MEWWPGHAQEAGQVLSPAVPETEIKLHLTGPDQCPDRLNMPKPNVI